MEKPHSCTENNITYTHLLKEIMDLHSTSFDTKECPVFYIVFLQ